jgi:hypothetical protein
MTTTDPFGPTLTAPDPISDGAITIRTDRSLDEMDAVLQLRGTDEKGHEMFGPTYFAELTRHEAAWLLGALAPGKWRPLLDADERRLLADRLRRLIAHADTIPEG